MSTITLTYVVVACMKYLHKDTVGDCWLDAAWLHFYSTIRPISNVKAMNASELSTKLFIENCGVCRRSSIRWASSWCWSRRRSRKRKASTSRLTRLSLKTVMECRYSRRRSTSTTSRLTRSTRVSTLCLKIVHPFYFRDYSAKFWPILITALHAMQTRSSDENSVCPSVSPSVRLSVKRVLCDKMEERSVQIFISYERSFSLVFWEEWLVDFEADCITVVEDRPIRSVKYCLPCSLLLLAKTITHPAARSLCDSWASCNIW